MLYSGSWGDVCCRHLSENNQWSIMSLFKISENNTEPGRISGECFGIRFTLTHTDDTRVSTQSWTVPAESTLILHISFSNNFVSLRKILFLFQMKRNVSAMRIYTAEADPFIFCCIFIKIRFSKNISNKITSNKVR